MRILFVMDPLARLNLEWDSSLCLLRELQRRGHENWSADVKDLALKKNGLFVTARSLRHLGGFRYRVSRPKRWDARRFRFILVRKDPPFDTRYLHLTYLLEAIAGHVPVINHPRGIRNTNEKIITLATPKWIPDTLVTSSPEEIFQFQKKLREDVILKPCDQKGGKGILLFPWRKKDKRIRLALNRATQGGKKVVIAQRFLKGPSLPGDKRVLLLEGKVLTAFERRMRKGEFRANLSLGATFHPTRLTSKEKQLVEDLRPYLVKEKLYFVGIDIMAEKLLEVNVTSPAGLVEAKILEPRSGAVERLADFLEALAKT